MQKRIIIVAFLIIAAALGMVFITRIYFSKPESSIFSARLVVPQMQQAKDAHSPDSSAADDDTVIASLIPLRSDETLLGVISMDFDGDSYDDQVNVIKTAASPYIQLLVGLYNPAMSTYERTALIATKIIQFRTFSYTGMDITGTHRLALVYQGFDEAGNSILQAFFLRRNTDRTSPVRQIANLEADGTIFIQHVERDDAYERSQAKGAAYPIWVYATDSSSSNSADQLQTRYEWNGDEQKYVQTAQMHVDGSRLAAKELARIQDGTVKTFAGFLNGLWYKLETGGGMRYLFFDYEEQEIIFFREETEEVYHWLNSRLQRNGIQLSTTNQEIENLQRRIDIYLLGIEEIRVQLQDDVRMIINESTMWDGDYKKMTNSAVATAALANKKENLAAPFVAKLEKEHTWKSADGTTVLFESGAYAVSGDRGSDSGTYTPLNADGKAFLQFRSAGITPWFTGIYQVSYAPTPTDADNIPEDVPIVLQPYLVTPQSSYPAEGRPIILSVPATEEEKSLSN